MGSVSFTQTISIKSGKNPENGTQMTQKDFEVYPAETTAITDWSENLSHRFAIPVGSVDLPICIGTLNSIKVLVVKPEADLPFKLINANGTSQEIVFTANRLSILHVNDITGILVSNPASTPIKGVIYVAGD